MGMYRSFADDVLRVHADDGFLGNPRIEFCVNESVHVGILALGAWLSGDRDDHGAVGFVKRVLRTPAGPCMGFLEAL